MTPHSLQRWDLPKHLMHDKFSCDSRLGRTSVLINHTSKSLKKKYEGAARGLVSVWGSCEQWVKVRNRQREGKKASWVTSSPKKVNVFTFSRWGNYCMSLQRVHEPFSHVSEPLLLTIIRSPTAKTHTRAHMHAHTEWKYTAGQTRTILIVSTI